MNPRCGSCIKELRRYEDSPRFRTSLSSFLIGRAKTLLWISSKNDREVDPLRNPSSTTFWPFSTSGMYQMLQNKRRRGLEIPPTSLILSLTVLTINGRAEQHSAASPPIALTGHIVSLLIVFPFSVRRRPLRSDFCCLHFC